MIRKSFALLIACVAVCLLAWSAAPARAQYLSTSQVAVDAYGVPRQVLGFDSLGQPILGAPVIAPAAVSYGFAPVTFAAGNAFFVDGFGREFFVDRSGFRRFTRPAIVEQRVTVGPFGRRERIETRVRR
jgi:hypothetical protein